MTKDVVSRRNCIDQITDPNKKNNSEVDCRLEVKVNKIGSDHEIHVFGASTSYDNLQILFQYAYKQCCGTALFSFGSRLRLRV
jgi:hypothetical protein